MTCLDLFLCLERPEIDFSTAYNNIVRHLIVVECSQDWFGSVEEAVNDSLDANVGPRVPDFDNFIGSKTDQMITLFVDVEVGY